jgi:hypothetical protein
VGSKWEEKMNLPKETFECIGIVWHLTTCTTFTTRMWRSLSQSCQGDWSWSESMVHRLLASSSGIHVKEVLCICAFYAFTIITLGGFIFFVVTWLKI